jgi:hypothetical protein
MSIEKSLTLKKKYQRPCMKVSTIELGVFGQYSDPDDGPKPPVIFNYGNTQT